MLPKIEVDERILSVCPNIKIGLIRANVTNTSTCDSLWNEILEASDWVRESFELLEINARPGVSATRMVYKSFGKDPNRYRVASEALCRRIIRGLGLYRLTALVDLINLVSIRSGYAISGLDADKIEGEILSLGIGQEGEQYEGIGRGLLNICGMPVYRDSRGGVATPTSDEERTKITEDTKCVQININGYGPDMPMDEAVDMVVDLLKRYANASNIETDIVDRF